MHDSYQTSNWPNAGAIDSPCFQSDQKEKCEVTRPDSNIPISCKMDLAVSRGLKCVDQDVLRGDQVAEDVQVVGKHLPITEYGGIRVVTLRTIDELHERPSGTAGRNFRKHRARLRKGEDYFELSPAEAKSMKFVDYHLRGKNLLLLTESGYLMLVKSFQDDLAWEVQRELVANYFRAKKRATSMTLDEILEDPKEGFKALAAMCRELEAEREVRLLVDPHGEDIQRRLRQLEEENRELAVYAELGREIAADPGTFPIRHIAQTLGTTAIQLNKFLADTGVFYDHGRSWYTCAKYTGTGHFKCCPYKTRSGEVSDHLRAYGKGVDLIHMLWREHSEAWLQQRRHKLTKRQRRARPFKRKRQPLGQLPLFSQKPR